MPRFKAEFAVKYRNENHFANEWFEIDAADAEEMKHYGTVEEDSPATPAPKAVHSEEPKKRTKKK